jgi:hypothetical protein
MGSFWGAVAGAVAVTLLPEKRRWDEAAGLSL